MQIPPDRCDEGRLYRYLSGELSDAEARTMAMHLDGCQRCHRRVAAVATFAQDVADRVRQAVKDEDFSALEKKILYEALAQRGPRRTRPAAVTLFKVLLSMIVAALCIGAAWYYHAITAAPVPGAAIRTLSGEAPAVLIYATPDRRQTLLWYDEDTLAKNDGGTD